MNWEVFWNAFGAIGTTIGSLITAVSVIMAVLQYRQPLSLYTQVELLLSDENKKSMYMKIVNTGDRDALIFNIYLVVKACKVPIIDYQNGDSKVSLPFTLSRIKPLEISLDKEVLIQHFQKYASEKSVSFKEKITIEVTDSSNGRYLYKPKIRLNKLME